MLRFLPLALSFALLLPRPVLAGLPTEDVRGIDKDLYERALQIVQGDAEKAGKVLSSLKSDPALRANPLAQFAALEILEQSVRLASGESRDYEDTMRAVRNQKFPDSLGDSIMARVLVLEKLVAPKPKEPAAPAAAQPTPSPVAAAPPVLGPLPAPGAGGGTDGPTDARTAFLQAIFPQSSVLPFQRGQEKLDGGDPRAAFSLFNESVQKGSSKAENFYFRGLAAERAGDHEQGHRDAAIALAIDPRDTRAGALFKLTQGKTSTIRLRTDASALREGAADAASEGSTGARAETPALQRADPLKIIEELRRQAGADPNEASARLTREAQRLLQVQDAQAAVVVARKAVELNARNAQAFNLLATAQARLGEHRAALSSVAQGLALAPMNPALLQTRSWTYNEMGDYRAAYSSTLELLRVRPEDPGAHYMQARALAGLGQRDAMKSALQKAAAGDPKFRPVYEQSLQLPEDADAALLFAGDPALTRAPHGPAKDRRPSLRFSLLTLLGGVLFAFGLLHVFSANWRERLRTTILRAAGAAPLPENAAGPFTASSGFWSQYEFQRELGVGGMGVVCEAQDKALGRRVAVKKMRDEIRSDARERERFLKEARTVAALRHPNIVEIYSIVEEGPELYLVFEFAEGRTLHELLAEKGSLPFPEALKVMRGVCAALEYAHGQGVVHRDLKPANIMVCPDGAVKVMDFGIARQAREAATRLTRTETVAGTPPYMAPEQEQGLVCKESDLYALGVMLYEMLTGTLPFEGTSAAMLLAKMAARYMPAGEREPSLPKGVDAVLAKALVPEPKERWRVPSGMLAALENLAS